LFIQPQEPTRLPCHYPYRDSLPWHALERVKLIIRVSEDLLECYPTKRIYLCMRW
jgi:hypothetical protein